MLNLFAKTGKKVYLCSPKMEAERFDKEDLLQAIQTMQAGGIILYPTDTVWGIGCDATNEEAVKRIYALKQREDSKSMLVLLDNAAKLDYYVDVPETAEMLLETESEKPMTIIYPHAKHFAPSIIAADGSIGIRITTETFSRQLCEKMRKPIVSTSANISGQPTARFFHEISQEIIDGVDYVCHYRRNDDFPHEPSSIIKLNEDGTFKILRP